MVHKGLLQRVLPAVLSAAMVFTSVPASALAAQDTTADLGGGDAGRRIRGGGHA